MFVIQILTANPPKSENLKKFFIIRVNSQLVLSSFSFQVVNATRNISAGEEIYISYLDECDQERSRHSRQKMLGENYLFVCNCDKCVSQQDEDDVTSEEEMSDDDEDSS